MIGFNVWPIYLLCKDRYKNRVAGNEIYYSIYKSKQKKKTKKLLLGDSVGNQMFSNKTNNFPIYSLTCNQAIDMVGHFLLLNNFINAGNHIDTVYLLFSPFSFQSNLNNKYTYHYFLKPFYTNEYSTLYTETVYEQIHKIPYYYLCRLPYILTSNWAPDFISKDLINYTFLSPISVEYLKKMKELAIKHNFKLIIIPTPTSFNKKQFVDRLDKNEIVKNYLVSEFQYYFDNIIYLPDSDFVDGTHFKDPSTYSEYYRHRFIK